LSAYCCLLGDETNEIPSFLCFALLRHCTQPNIMLNCLSYSAQELFSDVGDIKRFSINYDRSGRSKVPSDARYLPVHPFLFFPWFKRSLMCASTLTGNCRGCLLKKVWCSSCC
jgi:hypothetical protein